MTPWSSFYDLISPDLPGCPQIAQTNALRLAAIAFCEKSAVWKYEHPEIAVVVDTAEYAFVPPTGAVVHFVDYAEFDGSQIAVNVMDGNIQIWDWRNQTGTPEYVLGGATALTLVPTPDVAGTLTLTVTLKPSPAAEGVDDDIFNEYREAIVHGALARLLLSPKKPYTDAGLASYHQHQFIIKTGAAGLRTARNYTRAPLRTSIMNRR